VLLQTKLFSIDESFCAETSILQNKPAAQTAKASGESSCLGSEEPLEYTLLFEGSIKM
jgi:hypothetical protein